MDDDIRVEPACHVGLDPLIFIPRILHRERAAGAEHRRAAVVAGTAQGSVAEAASIRLGASPCACVVFAGGTTCACIVCTGCICAVAVDDSCVRFIGAGAGNRTASADTDQQLVGGLHRESQAQTGTGSKQADASGHAATSECMS